MAVISDASNDWSSAVTISGSAEFWQVRDGPVYLATGASSAPSDLEDGLLLEPGTIIELADGEVVRYRTTDSEAVIVRRAKA